MYTFLTHVVRLREYLDIYFRYNLNLDSCRVTILALPPNGILAGELPFKVTKTPMKVTWGFQPLGQYSCYPVVNSIRNYHVARAE